MCQRISCPRCHGRKIRKIVFASWEGIMGAKQVVQWHCLDCGESCQKPDGPSDPSQVLDVAIGVAVLFLIAGLALYLF